MKKRRTADEVARLLRDLDRDLAKGLTISDVCRKINIAETTYYRWRQRHDPAQVNADRRCRELEGEVERLKRLVAELMLDIGAETAAQEALDGGRPVNAAPQREKMIPAGSCLLQLPARPGKETREGRSFFGQGRGANVPGTCRQIRMDVRSAFDGPQARRRAGIPWVERS